ncbi:hypothetical protein [Enterococcus phage TJE1]|uniref:Uncharacterized protein n=1 Tax=Enterococcus phage TJE1 TaxID=2951262 RepID=A0A976SXQ4_9CAUD|nr:hypothetical protein [Enterococcus phage TJE1]
MAILLMGLTLLFMVLNIVVWDFNNKKGKKSFNKLLLVLPSVFGIMAFIIALTIAPTLNRANMIKYEVRSAENYVSSYTEEVKSWEERDMEDPTVFQYMQESKQDLSRAKVQLEDAKDDLKKLEQAKWWWNFNLF